MAQYNIGLDSEKVKGLLIQGGSSRIGYLSLIL
jgi:hypothetical protein